MIQACPFLNHNECIVAIARLETTNAVGVHRSTIFDATIFFLNCWNISAKQIEYLVPHSGFSSNDSNYMDHAHESSPKVYRYLLMINIPLLTSIREAEPFNVFAGTDYCHSVDFNQHFRIS